MAPRARRARAGALAAALLVLAGKLALVAAVVYAVVLLVRSHRPPP